MSGYGDCILQTILEGCTSSLECNCPHASVGLELSVITSCGAGKCPNQKSSVNMVPSSIPASCSGTVGRLLTYKRARDADEEFEAARKGVKDYHAITTTEPATPGSTPQPMARDTSAPAQPTSADSIVRMDVDRYEETLHQSEQTTTGTRTSSGTTTGSEGLVSRLLNWL